jgi:hypothetical protein
MCAVSGMIPEKGVHESKTRTFCKNTLFSKQMKQGFGLIATGIFFLIRYILLFIRYRDRGVTPTSLIHWAF